MLDDHGVLVGARNAYAYAPLRLIRAEEKDALAQFWGQPVKIEGPAVNQTAEWSRWPSWALDQYHHGLLRSDVAEDVLLGVASITFWGFAQGRGGRFTTARALARAGSVAGLSKRGADDADEIVQRVRRFSSLLDAGDPGAAVGEAMALKHHGLAFASKLLAFASPETACVYDQVISLRLLASKDQRLGALHVDTAGQHRRSDKTKAYDGWARLCAAKARELNEEGNRWKDWDGSDRPWRAVDVERAFFGLGRP